MRIQLITFLGLLLLLQHAEAQTPQKTSGSYDSLSLADLMNIKITVASIKELTPKQSPGIVNYITQDDIRQTGARDLMDVIQRIPGFEFGMDVEGAVGLGVRGNWAHEGKAVLLIDGQEMNDGLYSTLQFGNHYPVESIDHIEIIRGPGSAIYGGYAAYAVINVVTRQPKNKNEVQASAFYSATADDFGRRGTNLFLGQKGDNSSTSLQAYASQGQRSHKTYTDVYGDSYNMQDNSAIDNLYLNFGSSIGKLGIRAIADIYTIQTADEYQEIVDPPSVLHFNSYLTELNYELKLNDKWKLIPKFNYKYQLPWSFNGNEDNGEEPFKISSERYTGTINSIYDLNEHLNISSGISCFYDRSVNHEEGAVFNSTNLDVLTYNNFSGFVQGLFRSEYLNFIAGFRYNDNSRYGSVLVPRVGITRAFGNLNLKMLYGKSFRAPGTQNIDLSENIHPEVTNVYEMEAGFGINEFSYLTLNAYYIDTNDPIVYYFDTITNFDAYTNLLETGTQGLELAYRYKKQWGGIDFSASYYESNDSKNMDIYSVPGSTGEHLGLSPLKLDVGIRYVFSRQLSTSTSFTFYSKKHAITSLDTVDESAVYSEMPSTCLLNFILEYHLLKVKGLSFQLSMYNLLDNSQWYVQPYDSYHAPLPGMGRELQLKLTYKNF